MCNAGQGERMVRDITYCTNDDCPFEDCWRNPENLKNETAKYISISNFGGVCRRYLYHLTGEIQDENVEDYYLGDE